MQRNLFSNNLGTCMIYYEISGLNKRCETIIFLDKFKSHRLQKYFLTVNSIIHLKLVFHKNIRNTIT